MNRYHLPAMLIGLGFLSVTAGSTAPTDRTPDPRLSGGATTVSETGIHAFSHPAANTSLLRRDSFFIGNAFFKQPWVSAPASTRARDGLGPLFNANSCQGCHVKDGKSDALRAPGAGPHGLLVRLGLPARTPAEREQASIRGSLPDPVYGDQFQPNGIPGVDGEGRVRLDFENLPVRFSDGEVLTLRKPLLTLEALNYGPLAPESLSSVRATPVMIGLGLLAAIPEADILALADPEDADKDGISGRPNRVWDLNRQQTVLGRFGWKANQPSIAQQTAAAFHGDLGISSDRFPEQPCTEAQDACRRATQGGKPEISTEILEQVVFYASMLAVPARRSVDDPVVLQGERLFRQTGCAGCHRPAFQTGSLPGFPELEQQSIQPFTDLLLHDMGPGLADGRPDFEASGQEWRTAPLWGLGLVQTVNPEAGFLHDGRAASVMEAILWHGGEAETARQAVLALDKTDRNALVHFLESL
ncbi:MAG: c-type cytochrome [Thiothrix sp.]|nr:c-type cytochrome [Thiothrix sp.]